MLTELYNRGPLTAIELSRILDQKKNYIRSYLYRLEKYGCLSKTDGSVWQITETGIDIIIINDIDIANNNNIESNRKATEKQQKSNRKATVNKPTVQTAIDSFLSNSSTEYERVVVMALVKHYESTGEKYMYYRDPREFCDQMQIPIDDANVILAQLKQNGIIYIMKDKMLSMLKIGLKSHFVERLQLC
ncbi:MAG: hypothetical protein ABEK17_02410 [Candidatus Aenigmatarchaeota archaeon]